MTQEAATSFFWGHLSLRKSLQNDSSHWGPIWDERSTKITWMFPRHACAPGAMPLNTKSCDFPLNLHMPTKHDKIMHAVSRSWHFCIFQYVSWFVQKENAPWPISSFGGESPSPSWDSKWNHREKISWEKGYPFQALKKNSWHGMTLKSLRQNSETHFQSLVMSEMPTSMPMTKQLSDFPIILGWSHQFRAFSGRSKARPSRRHAKLHHLRAETMIPETPRRSKLTQINMNRFAFLLLRLFFGAFTSKKNPLPQESLWQWWNFDRKAAKKIQQPKPNGNVGFGSWDQSDEGKSLTCTTTAKKGRVYCRSLVDSIYYESKKKWNSSHVKQPFNSFRVQPETSILRFTMNCWYVCMPLINTAQDLTTNIALYLDLYVHVCILIYLLIMYHRSQRYTYVCIYRLYIYIMFLTIDLHISSWEYHLLQKSVPASPAWEVTEPGAIHSAAGWWSRIPKFPINLLYDKVKGIIQQVEDVLYEHVATWVVPLKTTKPKKSPTLGLEGGA